MNAVQLFSGLGEEPTPTIQVMDYLIRRGKAEPWALSVAQFIVGNVTDPREQARMIQAAVKQRIKYRPDPVGLEWVQDPAVTWAVTMSGDCDDQAVLAGALLGALGHHVAPVAVQWTFRAYPSHAVLQDLTAGCIVDPVTLAPDQWPPYPVRKLIRV